MDFPSVFVAMSRVKQAEHLRLLPKKQNPSNNDEYSYLTKLEPNESVMQYYRGYQNDQGVWDKDRALQSLN